MQHDSRDAHHFDEGYRQGEDQRSVGFAKQYCNVFGLAHDRHR